MKPKNSILIAEDDPILREVYIRRFARTNFEVRTAVNGQEACEMIKERAPDLLICDVMMPEHDGWWVLEQFPKGQRPFPAVMLTNLEDDATKQKCIDMGADGYLVKKDMSLASLVETAEKLLKGALNI